ncbi:rhodanese-like domain-containing protein [Rhodalgimonas zhirmunskyi]|uniref:Rhodanese-like domain-containing protein n=1 Tax=Rhodalgimonas zhirmunskyi TaxID=2964767 RepID=A0AAJ1U9Z4_9RHOB|nr:rhodanese-like domain-containing protein [Rhodoalgimonas zhirmunskyi]MDQ2093943.1 rhodanese-like domain-containing protein [Rhodoalgimonas zhirmunskyi]
MRISRHILPVSIALSLCAAPALAQEVRLAPDELSRQIALANGRVVTIQREQDQSATLSGEFTKTSRACPPFCIQPATATPGVETVGELELIDFIEKNVASGKGLLIDSRLPEWYIKGTIPGAVNVPFTTLEASNPYRDEILKALGARQTGGRWDFTGAMQLAFFSNGPWDGQSIHAIKALTSAGYPPEKLHYYRGGMQVWLLLGLTANKPTS